MLHPGKRALGSIIAIVLLYSFPAMSADRLDWMPPSVASSKLDASASQHAKVPIRFAKLPRPTSNKKRFTRRYVLNLDKFKISNRGQDPVATSNGINAALQYAKRMKYNYISFPQGTYLISENIPIVLNHKDTIVDLNGSRLQINPNGLKKYTILKIETGAENLRLTNGEIRGDRDVHDFKTLKGSHEWGTAIRVRGGKGLEIDHLRLHNTPGDGIGTAPFGSRNRPELLAMIKATLTQKSFEVGGFTKRGVKTNDPGKMRLKKMIDAKRCGGMFEFGYLAGSQGYPYIRSRDYQTYFYDKNMRFIKKVNCLQYRKQEIPKLAAYFNIEINQGLIASEPAHSGAGTGWIARIANFKPPRDVHVHHNTFHMNRRLGIAFCGGQRWIIEDNLFDTCGGTAPGYGIDFEDAWELMQDVVVRNNRFKNNVSGDIVVCAGQQLHFEGNQFTGNVSFWGRPYNYVFTKNSFNGGRVRYMTRSGIATIEKNTYKHCTISVVFDTKAIADGIHRKDGKNVSTPPMELRDEKMEDVRSISGTYIKIIGSEIKNSKVVASERTALLHFEKNKLTNVSVSYKASAKPIIFVSKENRGSLNESGPGMGRKAPVRD